MDKYTMELLNLHNNEFGDENTRVAIQEQLHLVFYKLHIETCIIVQFSKETKWSYMYSEELAKVLLEIKEEIQAE